MAASALLSLVPGASRALCDILDPSRGSVQAPIRADIFGAQRFEQHGNILGQAHRDASDGPRRATFFPRLRDNIRALRESHEYIGLQAHSGYDISPAAEWLLDNFHVIEAQIKEIHDGLPRSYFRKLPVLQSAPLAGLPRIYGVAWSFVAHTDGAFDEELLTRFLTAYQDVCELKLAEAWALPTTLRVVLVESLRRLAERVATNKAAREIANICFDHIDQYDGDALDRLRDLLDRRGVASVFLAQMAQRLHDRRTTGEDAALPAVQDWLRRVLPDLGTMQTQQRAAQAEDNLSVSNAVNSLRAIGDSDWSGIIARTNALVRLMLTSSLFAAEDDATRDQTLHAIEKLAKRRGLAEASVGRTLLGLMQPGNGREDPASVAHHWLRGNGQSALTNALGLHTPWGFAWQDFARRAVFPLYLLVLLGALGGVIGFLLRHDLAQTGAASPAWVIALGMLAMAFPASEAVVAVLNRLICESIRPHHMPRLALADGIPTEHRVMVVIPCMLTDGTSTRELAHRLELHYLANPEAAAQFALLSDWADAGEPQLPTDRELLAEARQHIDDLNRRYPRAAAANDPAPRFLLLHRDRVYSESEQRWIGWERKRGKLEQLVSALAQNCRSVFLDLGAASCLAKATRYIVTLDSDTQLPPGRLRELVGVAAHPHNQPRLDDSGHAVVSGYGILQPRIVTPLPAARCATAFHWLFSGQCGIDPYSAASSEVYQDLFSEGTFTGKGLLHVRAMHAVLSGRLSDGQILSHDLLEGSIARCAAVSDITVIEEAPFHADVAAARVHRWTRGDWQLLPVLLASLMHPARSGIRAVNLWKMFDNLRRSLVAPMSLVLLIAALAGALLSPWAALALVSVAFSAGPLMGALTGFAPGRVDFARRHFYAQAATDLVRAILGGVWHMAQLLQQSLLSLDAIGRALYRTAISRRQLLQWTTAATVQSRMQTSLAAALRRHRNEPVVALLLLSGLLISDTPYPLLSILLCLTWAGAPVWTWWVSRARPVSTQDTLTQQDALYLAGIGRDTWRLFERCVVADEHHLPPDNLQLSPHDMVAHRTSPTNIGLYLLSTACARQFGWIGTQELLSRLEATLGTLLTLERHRGHYFNWYDTRTRAPLLPTYVSTVDSGNLVGHLLTVAQACLELAHAPLDGKAADGALAASRARIGALWMRRPHLTAAMRTEIKWLLADHRACLRSTGEDGHARLATDTAGVHRGDTLAAARLRDVARTCTRLAWEADFSFLYHRKRHLFHIGYRTAEHQRDAGFYDLLASESRLTSLLAIAKGDAPVRHWASLGRPFFATGTHVGLRSWTGSLFEYLMPSLVLAEPHGSVLWSACDTALREHIAFARTQGVPWGMSESAYAASDYTLAYQYAPQGVARLALRRTPPDELVIAPYATALALLVSPRLAVENFRVLEGLGARGRYGFMEALDYTPSRRPSGSPYAPVDTVMAHHQGMSIVAMANTLLDGVAQRWGMANAPLEAVASLLQERVPRTVSLLYAPPHQPASLLRQRRSTPGQLREVLPGAAAVEPTHLLSNGRYAVALRANGAGWSHWGAIGISRQRDDALRDDNGSFFYVRWSGHSELASLTSHPAPDPLASYRSVYHADRVCFDTRWTELQAQTTVWVSPEDDIEFRKVELRNLGDRPLDIELVSAFEVTLAERLADEAHPAFSNLFVRAEWQTVHRALLFERKPRLPTEPCVQLAHFLATSDPRVRGMAVQTERQQWQGRNRSAARPLGALIPLPAASPEDHAALATGLDPVCALGMTVHLEPGARVQLTFATAVSDSHATLMAVIDKYRQPNNVQRASLMATTLAAIRLRALRISVENYVAMQTLTTALTSTLARPPVHAPLATGTAPHACDRRLLWRFGISGDKPIILVRCGVPQGLGLLRAMAQALKLWAWAGVACDLVVVNSEPASYLMSLQREIATLLEHHRQETSGLAGSAATGFHSLQADDLTADELSTLKAHARLRLHADGRPLAHHVQEWIAQHEAARAKRQDVVRSPLAWNDWTGRSTTVPQGVFAPEGAFAFAVGDHQRPSRPWINVLSNPDFGTQVSESGSGYTWAVNSRLNQLTAWSNDAVADPPSEWFLLQDTRSGQVWSVTPNAWGPSGIQYRITHDQGLTEIHRRQGDLEVALSWCVDAATSVKQIALRLTNHGHKPMHLRVVGIVEWLMGASRADRATVHTAFEPPQANAPALLLCTQRERSAGFGDGTAFFSLSMPTAESADWTCDRREFHDTDGRMVLPARLGQSCGDGLDPCAALSTHVYLPAGGSAQRAFLLGYAGSAESARHLAAAAARVDPDLRIATSRAHWNHLLNATTVKTPDPLFDVMVNRWLLYQAVGCRLWAKAGFYQAGGATGFRDQLQDAMVLVWTAPGLLRQQIVLCASRQFAEGDVQHWWHAPLGAGVRTHFSDDLLWLAHACLHYVQSTGDSTVLDEQVPFLEGPAIADDREDAYFTPLTSTLEASVYEHAARAVDRSLRVGAHGLPLMGSGDWNDGMNRVGPEGRGESVWLGWFLWHLVSGFAPLARARAEPARAQRWEAAAEGWKAALDGPAWDGHWYRRAFFDNGQPLGSAANPEARIDLIAQAWSVLSGQAPQPRAGMALAAMDAHLVDIEHGLIKLLDPPLVHSLPSAGYIQAYPPGVRENGGQYSHGAVWALMARAALHAQDASAGGVGEDAYRYFTYLSPAHRSEHARRGAAYGLEPYAMAGDVYTQPPYVGRGGWSWYTGAAAWMHRAAIESILGLQLQAQHLVFQPCVPSHWDQAELTLVRAGRTMRFILVRATLQLAAEKARRWNAAVLPMGRRLDWRELPASSTFVVPLLPG